jgi:hypothetical protein
MRKIVLAIFAVLAVGAVVAAAAFASGPEWLCNGQPITGTGNSRCLINSLNLGAFQFEDMGLGAAECPAEGIEDEGWVGPGAEAEVTRVTFTLTCSAPAKFENLSGVQEGNACEGAPASAPVVGLIDLPWKTKITEKEGTNKKPSENFFTLPGVGGGVGGTRAVRRRVG